MTNPRHITVLLNEAVDGLFPDPKNPKSGGVYVDGTLGAGGHTEQICKVAPKSTIIGIDADADAIERAKVRLAGMPCTLITSTNFNDKISEILEENRIDEVDGVLLDLGMSSDQLDRSGRGFSFLRDEPLKMTMQSEISENDLDAYKIVNSFNEEQLATVIFGYGDEKYSRRIAKAIVEKREESPIETTGRLAEIIKRAVPFHYRNGRTHPATKTFQALRISVNDEIERLESTLAQSFNKLKIGGRLSVISFHSLEDRMVKRFARAKSDDGLAKIITKRPMIPTPEEIKENPRSRSAKLRIIEKIN
jgi:16S rRNA (cytosine1402-N4)-methyltransferase